MNTSQAYEAALDRLHNAPPPPFNPDSLSARVGPQRAREAFARRERLYSQMCDEVEGTPNDNNDYRAARFREIHDQCVAEA